MLKVMAVLRTLFLAFLVVYVLRAMTMTFDMAPTINAQYELCTEKQREFRLGVWYAAGWIAFDAAVGWMIAAWAGKRRAAGITLPPAKT